MSTLIDIINIITAVIASASAIAALTPTKKDDIFLAKIKPFIDIIALNFGNAKK
tara:strand:+ start:4261 stop:4422 length:162 start_codon:yes stop_codon:yes gene_type:complete